MRAPGAVTPNSTDFRETSPEETARKVLNHQGTSVFSVSSVVHSSAFTLLEMLVATAILALMMSFLFNLLGSSAKLWEVGNKKIEAAQSARVGLNIMANDLKNAFAGNMTSYSSSGTPIQNVAPFLAIQDPGDGDVMDLSGNAKSAEGSQQLYGVTSTGDTSDPFEEFGYLSVFLEEDDGNSMIGNNYYLVRKMAKGTAAGGSFFLRAASDTWAEGSTDFSPVIDNCIRVTFQYYGNETLSNGTPDWTDSGSWIPNDRLPLGVLVTVTVLDSKTAIKVADIKGGTPLTKSEIDSIFKNTAPQDGLETILRQGAITMSRFIPLNRQ